jgi:hypothetical protein
MIASASTITLESNGNYFVVTGTTTINRIDSAGWKAGSVIFVRFTDFLTLTHNASAIGNAKPINLASGTNATGIKTISLVYDEQDAKWYELSRVM